MIGIPDEDFERFVASATAAPPIAPAPKLDCPDCMGDEPYCETCDGTGEVEDVNAPITVDEAEADMSRAIRAEDAAEAAIDTARNALATAERALADAKAKHRYFQNHVARLRGGQVSDAAYSRGTALDGSSYSSFLDCREAAKKGPLCPNT